MHKSNTRAPNPSELEALHIIWNTVFGSTDRTLFFENMYNPELSVICEYEASIAAMGFLLPVGDLVTLCGDGIPCVMIYGMATLPEYRGNGFGGIVSRKLIKTAKDAGFPAVILYPADDGLYNYYAKHSDMREWFYGIEYNYAKPIPGFGYTEFEQTSVEDYMTLRENLLSNVPHIRYNERPVEYQSKLCELYGGNLYRFKTVLGDSCAVVERQSGNAVCVKELLIPCQINPVTRQDLLLKIFSTIAKEYPAEKYIVRTPELYFSGNSRECMCKKARKKLGMLSISDDINLDNNNKTASPWYGIAFD